MYLERRLMLKSIVRSILKNIKNTFIKIIIAGCVVHTSAIGDINMDSNIIIKQMQDHYIATPPNRHKWTNDLSHSNIIFSVEYMKLSKITGTFEDIYVELWSNQRNQPNSFDNSEFHCIINAESINTLNITRDTHLKSEEFLNCKKYPTIDIKGILKKGIKKNILDLTGELTLNGITKVIKYQVVYTGSNKNMNGDTIAGFIIKGRISRKDFNITWNKILDNNIPLISDSIQFEANIHLLEN